MSGVTRSMNVSEAINETLGTSDVVWNIADLYKGYDDPAIEADIKWAEQEALDISEEFSGHVHELDARGMFNLVSRLENLETRIGKLATFAFLNFAVNTHDQQVSAFLQRVREVGSSIGTNTVFFELEWNQIENNRVDQILAGQTLNHYRHYLGSMRKYAPHQLSPVEERLLIERAPVGRGRWTTLFEKVMGHQKFGEKQRSEEEVLSDLYDNDRSVRQQAASELTEGLRSQLHILTHIFNTLLADKMINDRLRSYGSWVSSMNMSNELEDATVETLVGSVTTRYDIVQRYYTIKKGLLKLDELRDYDRYAPLPNLPGAKISWRECQDIVLNAFNEFSPRAAEIAAMFFDRDWIHAPVLGGKRGGAFAHPCVPEAHPYVMVNYTGNLRDVATVAHELGHGIHQYLAAERGYYNSNTPLVLAETASVFAELLVFKAQLALIEDAQQKRAFICQKLESIFATVFRQVSMNRFEDLVHNARRQQGELSSDKISACWMDTQRPMFADSVTLSEDYGIWWSYIPHFLSTPGYVYSYAFGELLVLALYNLYQQEGDVFVEKYIELLSAGGSETPYELVKPFGVDLDSEDFWNGGLRVIEDMLALVE